MATYKVIQDIEAEDHILGPFSLRQFIYILIAVFLGYVSFICVSKGAAFLLVVLVPPMLFCMFFAWPWSPDQPTEVWALARIRFLVKSRKRIWDQSGIKDFVTVTVPKAIEKNYTDGLSQTEVRSRLQALADTIDSRGWAVKNSYGGGPVIMPNNATDRLLGFDAMPQEVVNNDIRPSDDILDDQNNSAAYHMNEMIDASSKAHRQQIIDRLNDKTPATLILTPAQPQQAWFTQSQPAQPVINVTPTAAQATTPLPTVPQPAQPASPALNTQPAPIKTQADPAILNLAHDNNMDIATLAREAKRAKDLEASGEEVVISLH